MEIQIWFFFFFFFFVSVVGSPSVGSCIYFLTAKRFFNMHWTNVSENHDFHSISSDRTSHWAQRI